MPTTAAVWWEEDDVEVTDMPAVRREGGREEGREGASTHYSSTSIDTTIHSEPPIGEGETTQCLSETGSI